jgi:class 3 adenylate cyclase/tetratricopeptide (TPR) repeat protein
MKEIADWLEKLGTSEYAQRFAENAVDFSVLPDLTDQDLEKLGVLLGHRRKLLRAIADLEGVEKGAPPVPVALAPSATPRAAEFAERRQVTVMFSDLVGSTALSPRMDPEDLREVISAYQKCVAETVQRFGGFVAKYMGDGVLVYFGYPQAHEDDAERAVRAGLELVAEVAGAKSSVPLQARVGIATGLVVVGDLIGSGEAQERGIVGETPNLAARLQGVAEPNSVVIAESTRKLLGNLFELEDLGATDLKGIAGPVRSWMALRASRVESRFEALHASGLTELVGREEELDLFLRRWSKVQSGQGQVVLISGEAGIGKSRLTVALMERLASEPHTRLRYFCSPQHTDSALYPVIGQIERAAGFVHDDTSQAKLDKLDAVLAQTSTSIQDAALLADMLSLRNDGRFPALDLAPEQRRQRTLEALGSQMETLARPQPVLMIFEDAHWTDPTSLELFGRVVARIRTLRILLLMTFRSEFQAPWVGRPYVMALNVNRLTERDISAMIDNVVGNQQLPANVRQEIIERTDGIPLFVEEMTREVLEARSEGAAHAGIINAAARPARPGEGSGADRGSNRARVFTCTISCGGAQAGGGLGISTRPSHSRRFALPARRAAACELPVQAWLVQEAAYSTLLRSRRQQLHARITATMEGQFPEIVEAQPEVLARHSAEAGSVEKAVGYWLKAGQQAIARWAMTEAVAQLREGLDLLSRMPDDVARQERELDLQIELGRALFATKGYAAPEAGEAFARARQLCELLDRPPRLEVLIGQFEFRIGRGELQQAEHHAEGMCRVGEARNDLRWNAAGLACSGFISFLRGRFTDARAYYESAIGLWDPMYRPSVASPDDPHVGSLIILSRTLLCLGYVDQARLRRDEALAEARRISPYNQIYALCDAWPGDWALMGAKEARAALQSAEEALASSRDQSFPMFLGVGHIMRGWYLGAVGQAAEGIPLLLQGVAIRRVAGTNLLLPFFLTIVAEVYGCSRKKGSNGSPRLLRLWGPRRTAGPRPKCIGCGGSYCFPCISTRERKKAIVTHSQWRGSRAPNSGSCVRPSISRSSGAIRASGKRLASFSRQSTDGSPKASIRAI